MKFVESIKALPGRTKAGIDTFLVGRLGFQDKQLELLWHYAHGLWIQVLAIIPISVLQIAVLGIFYQQTIVDPGLQVMGMFLAILGLTMFLDGLRCVRCSKVVVMFPAYIRLTCRFHHH